MLQKASVIKYRHKKDDAGMCQACAGKCKYADGGPVLPGAQDAQESLRKAFKFSDGGSVKGVHREKAFVKGQSHAGSYLRKSQDPEMSEAHNEEQLWTSKQIHKAKLHELKYLPKPKLQGLSKGGKIEVKKHPKDIVADPKVIANLRKRLKAINHKEMMEKAPEEYDEYRQSEVDSKEKMSQGGRVYSIGPEKDMRQPSKAALTAYDHGGEVDKEDLIEEHKNLVKNLKGSEDEYHKQKAELSELEGEDVDHEVMEMCVDELMESIEKKDKKGILEALKSLIGAMK